jgi:hypothetical protein
VNAFRFAAAGFEFAVTPTGCSNVKLFAALAFQRAGFAGLADQFQKSVVLW